MGFCRPIGGRGTDTVGLTSPARRGSVLVVGRMRAMFAKLQNWIAKKSPSYARQIVFSFDGHTITADGPIAWASLRVEAIREIGIETTDTGPAVEDVFWLINRDSDRLLIPQDSAVFKKLKDYFRSYEGFNWQSFTEAMSCTERRYFLCWQREHEST